MTDWREMVSDEAMPLGHQQAAELPTDEDGACLACGTPLQLCGHRPDTDAAGHASEHVELTREEGRQFMASLAGEVDEQGYPAKEDDPYPRCGDPDCDGDAGHDGPHFQWVPE